MSAKPKAQPIPVAALLSPAAVDVPYRGLVVEVRPLTIDQLGPAARAAESILPVLNELIELAGSKDEAAMISALVSALAKHSDAMRDFVVAASGADEELIRHGHLDEFVSLLVAVVKVNVDFFAQRLAPVLAQARGLGAGLTQSKSSLQTGTRQ